MKRLAKFNVLLLIAAGLLFACSDDDNEADHQAIDDQDASAVNQLNQEIEEAEEHLDAVESYEDSIENHWDDEEKIDHGHNQIEHHENAYHDKIGQCRNMYEEMYDAHVHLMEECYPDRKMGHQHRPGGHHHNSDGDYNNHREHCRLEGDLENYCQKRERTRNRCLEHCRNPEIDDG